MSIDSDSGASAEITQRKRSEEVILALNGAIQVVRYHATDNDAATVALGRLQSALAVLLDQHFDVSVLFYAHDFYVNEVRVRPSTATFELFEALAAQLAERGVGTIDVHSTPSRADLGTLVKALFDPDEAGTTPDFACVVSRLEAAEITTLSLQPHVPTVPENLPVIDKGEFVRQAYFSGITLMRQLFAQAKEWRPLALKKATRVVQNFVDAITHETQAHHDTLLLLTRVKNYLSYNANHAVNTSVLAVAFGHALEIDRSGLRELGVAAILADIGNATLPDTVGLKTGPLNPKEQQDVAEHPIRGAALVAGFQELSELVVAAALGCAEHHRGPTAGYPQELAPPRGINAAVIAVCDRYDALTTARPHRPMGMTTAEALQTLAGEADLNLDRAVVNAFCWWHTGLPAGHVLRRADGSMDIVVQPPPRSLRHVLEKLNAELNGG